MSNSDNGQNDSNIVFNRHSNTPSAKPKAHRCNEHLEDVLNGISSWPMDFSKPFGVFWKCLRSQPGQEPALYRNRKSEASIIESDFVSDEK